MAGNLLKNAGLLDLTNDWVSGGGALQVDESTVGAPGRVVMVAGGAGVATSSVNVSVGDELEVLALVGADVNRPRVEFVILNGGGATISATVVPFRRLGSGACRRGLTASFSEAYARITVAAAGAARLSIAPNGGGMSHIYAFRPYIGRPGLAVMRWDPGTHSNPDLNLPVWPADLPGFRGQPAVEPFANLKAFAGDAGLPANGSLYSGLHHQVKGQMRLSAEQDDILDQFYARRPPAFYFVRPDTGDLCIAEWLADGAPRLVETRGQYVFREVGLHTRPA
ncbi:hypothetical protein [Caulobacter sp. 1776]|uniref:hypothetical protein n=1 Tax=Caulobacter sp. 1776 TaxID=3156420 RepID=UPI00339AF82B